MDNFYLSALVRELTPEVQGRTVTRISLDGTILSIGLRLAAGRQLLISLDRTTPALYLSSEPSNLSKSKRTSTYFLSLARKHLVDARLVKISKDALDRIVHIDFEKLDAGDNRIQVSLLLYLTGRSANACLIDANRDVIGMLFDQDMENRLSQPAPLDAAKLTGDLGDSMTESEILARFFGAGSQFGPQLKNEFLVRSESARPVDAFRSLVEDLFHRDPLPLVYSKLPLEQASQVVINPKTDLLLSHIELVQARGMVRSEFSSLSEAADKYYSTRRPALALRDAYAVLKQTLTREIDKRESTLSAIESDRLRFANPERLKQYGDLLLANLANARIDGDKATVIDYYDPSQAETQIEITEGATLQEAATGYFARYQKARRALEAIASREKEVSGTLAPLKNLLTRLEEQPTAECIDAVSESAQRILGITRAVQPDKRKPERGKSAVSFGRRFKSSDGYEIVVGRNDRDNDALTFRVAKPHDIWLHAADYPGSHAIIRNPSREPPPHRTITEAAELAAFYSQAKREGKAAVHYALRKFISKPPRSKPGLVRLSSFKTIMVQPRCTLERLV